MDSSVQGLSGLLRLHLPRSACTLLVHQDIQRLEEAAALLRQRYGWPCLSVGRELSAALRDEPLPCRPRAADLRLSEMLRARAPGPVLCTEIDLLFEPALSLDPLRLLVQASRHTALVVLWPGHCSEDLLAYAVPAHAHYRTWPHPEVDLICL